MIMNSDDKEGCRSLVCDSNGIIIAEMVYRCMVCASISDTIFEAQKHYQIKHIDGETQQSSSSLKNEPLNLSDMPEEDYDDLDINDDDDEDLDNDLDQSPQIYNVPSSLKELQQQYTGSMNDAKSLIRRNLSFPPSSTSFPTDVSMAKPKSNLSISPSSPVRGGFVTCAVCNITKFYASVQRRYGQFTCMGCAKFFGRFLIKPRRYCCPNLGNCPLDATPRCKACLLQACIDTYSIDEKRLKIVEQNRPIRKNPSSRQPASGISSGILPSPDSQLMMNNPLHAIKQQRASLLNQSNQAGRSKSTNSAVLALLKSTGKKNWGCRKCAGCLVEDCGKCNYCLDKPKFGGANTLKKKCILRKCLLQEQQKLEQAQNSLRNALK